MTKGAIKEASSQANNSNGFNDLESFSRDVGTSANGAILPVGNDAEVGDWEGGFSMCPTVEVGSVCDPGMLVVKMELVSCDETLVHNWHRLGGFVFGQPQNAGIRNFVEYATRPSFS